MFKADELPNSIYGIILDDQGGQQITVRTDGKSPTLRAEAHGNVPCVMAVDGYNGAVSQVSPTLGVNCGISTGRNGVLHSAGFKPRNGSNARTLGFEAEMSPTIETSQNEAVVYAIDQQGGKGGANYAEDVMPTICSDSHGTPHAVVYAIENHPADSRVNIDGSGKCQTLTSRMGTGGNNVPMVMELMDDSASKQPK